MIELSRNDPAGRYEAHLDGELAGFADFHMRSDVVVFTHTVVDDRFEGRGVGSELARFALDDVRSDGRRRVLPRCPFIKAWIQRHPEYAPLVSGASVPTPKEAQR